MIDLHNALIAGRMLGGGGGTSDYTQLTNKPQINGVTLTGNKSTADLDISEPWVGTAAEYAAAATTIPVGTPVIITDDTDMDTTPTQGSTNPVTSGGLYTALAEKADSDDFVPITKSAFDALVSKTAKFYFVYPDPASSLQSFSPSLNLSPEPENLSEEVLTDDSGEDW